MLSKQVKARRKANRLAHRAATHVNITITDPQKVERLMSLTPHKQAKLIATGIGQGDNDDMKVFHALTLRGQEFGRGPWRGRHFRKGLDDFPALRDYFPLHLQRELERAWHVYRKLRLTALQEQQVEEMIRGVNTGPFQLRQFVPNEEPVGPAKVRLERELKRSQERDARRFGELLARESLFQALLVDTTKPIRAYGETEMRIAVSYEPPKPWQLTAVRRRLHLQGYDLVWREQQRRARARFVDHGDPLDRPSWLSKSPFSDAEYQARREKLLDLGSTPPMPLAKHTTDDGDGQFKYEPPKPDSGE